jgi:hypothetical protein
MPAAVESPQRQLEFEFCASLGRARKNQIRSDFSGPLTHPGQAPMPSSPAHQYFRINAAAIVLNPHAQLAGKTGDFDLNPRSVGMFECIADSFPGNPVKLVTNQGINLVE